jgi:hypothetical protein
MDKQCIHSLPYLVPFPGHPSIPSHPLSKPSPLSFKLDWVSPGATSPVPSLLPSPYAGIPFYIFVHVIPTCDPTLTGTVVVHNITYDQHVAVRYTLDEWQTMSEVSSHHVVSLPSLLPTLLTQTMGNAVSVVSPSPPLQEKPAALWARFSFSIRLEDHAYNLHTRVMWLGSLVDPGNGGIITKVIIIGSDSISKVTPCLTSIEPSVHLVISSLDEVLTLVTWLLPSLFIRSKNKSRFLQLRFLCYQLHHLRRPSHMLSRQTGFWPPDNPAYPFYLEVIID